MFMEIQQCSLVWQVQSFSYCRAKVTVNLPVQGQVVAHTVSSNGQSHHGQQLFQLVHLQPVSLKVHCQDHSSLQQYVLLNPPLLQSGSVRRAKLLHHSGGESGEKQM